MESNADRRELALERAEPRAARLRRAAAAPSGHGGRAVATEHERRGSERAPTPPARRNTVAVTRQESENEAERETRERRRSPSMRRRAHATLAARRAAHAALDAAAHSTPRPPWRRPCVYVHSCGAHLAQRAHRVVDGRGSADARHIPAARRARRNSYKSIEFATRPARRRFIRARRDAAACPQTRRARRRRRHGETITARRDGERETVAVVGARRRVCVCVCIRHMIVSSGSSAGRAESNVAGSTSSRRRSSRT